ncbi:hypothetical protein D3C81_2210910 [compost metagenome]
MEVQRIAVTNLAQDLRPGAATAEADVIRNCFRIERLISIELPACRENHGHGVSERKRITKAWDICALNLASLAQR